MNTRFLALGLGLLLATGASAEGMEERLRTQLRSTTQQLQALQSQQAQASAAQLAAQNEAKAAQAQIKQLTAELAKAKGLAEQLAGQQQSLHSQAQAQVAASAEQTGKFKKPMTNCWSSLVAKKPNARSCKRNWRNVTHKCSNVQPRISKCTASPNRSSRPTKTSTSPK